MGDDAFGPWVIHRLSTAYDVVRDGVEVIDVGTPGLDLTPYLSGADAIVLVDTVRSDGAPGELRLYRREQILKLAPQPRLSPHDPGVAEALQLLELSGEGPGSLLFVGAIPGRVEKGIGLTPPLQEAVSSATELVLLELVRLGVTVERRRDAAAGPWWEAAPEALNNLHHGTEPARVAH
jgi:hydrogenase maturation protease